MVFRFMMGLTPQVHCCWIVKAINHQNLSDHEVTNFLFNCLQHNTIGTRIMENNLRHITLLYVWLNTVFNLFIKRSEFSDSFKF